MCQEKIRLLADAGLLSANENGNLRPTGKYNQQLLFIWRASRKVFYDIHIIFHIVQERTNCVQDRTICTLLYCNSTTLS